MNRKKIALLTVLLIIICIIFDAFAYAPRRVKVRKEEIISNKLGKSFDDFKIVFFSDVHYDEYIVNKDIEKLVDLINKENPDMVLFGGDLIDRYSQKGYLTQDKRDFLISKLKEIEAPFGKYAVLGNHDTDYIQARIDVTDILENADFEVIINTNKTITKNNESFKLVGLDTLLWGTLDIDQAYLNVAEDNFVLTVAHCPDSFDYLDKNRTDYVLAAHSHGGQVYLPLINNLYRPIGCKNYFKGKYTVDNTILDITNGFGVTNKSIRLLADAEIVVYTLKAN